ncbi:MAG: MFS transporter [Pseudomonadales bacterium]
MTEPAEDLPQSETWIVRNGLGVQVMETLAVGAFLTALAVQLGAPNWMIGALAAIPHLAQIAQIPALWTVEKVRQRRRIYLLSGAVARPMLFVIAIAAVALPPMMALWVILLAFTLRYVAGAFLSCAWNSWMRDLVPEDELGRLFGNRQRKMIGISILFSLLAAGFIDAWTSWVLWPVTYAYSVVYVIAFLGGAYSVICARRIFEPTMQPATHEPLLAQIRKPFAQENYRRLITFLGSWNFAVNLAAPFFTVYMLRRLEYDLIIVIGLATLSQLAAFVTVKNWGLFADRVSNKTVLRTCCPIFILAIFGWTFTTLPDPHEFTLALLVVIHILTGISTAGVNLSTANIALKLAPQGDAPAYLSASAMVNAAAAGVAALLGGITVDLMASWQLSLSINWQSADSELALNAMHFSHWDFFFLLAVVLGIYALHRLSLVSERGEVQDARLLSLLLGSTRQSLKNLSTIAGLRDASNFPLDELLIVEDEEKKRADTDDENEPPR